MKGRNITDIEKRIMKKFFFNDMNDCLIPNDELDAMIFANEILEEDNEVLIYDITDNLKYCILISIDYKSLYIDKNLSQFLIDIENEEVIQADDFDYLLPDNQLQND